MRFCGDPSNGLTPSRDSETSKVVQRDSRGFPQPLPQGHGPRGPARNSFLAERDGSNAVGGHHRVPGTRWKARDWRAIEGHSRVRGVPEPNPEAFRRERLSVALVEKPVVQELPARRTSPNLEPAVAARRRDRQLHRLGLRGLDRWDGLCEDGRIAGRDFRRLIRVSRSRDRLGGRKRARWQPD